MPWQDDPVVKPAPQSWRDDPIRRGAVAELARRELERRQAKPERTPVQQFAHEQGLGARSVAEGLASAVTIPSDALAGLLDFALEKAGVSFRFGSSSQALSGLLTKAGVPNPENENERTALNIGRAVSSVPAMVATGGALSGGAASPVVAGVGRTMAANPILQATSAGTGATGSEIARRSGAGPVGQVAAGIAGAALPSVLIAGTQAAVRGVARGGEQGRQRVAENVRTFEGVGTTPTVGQATEGRAARATESLLSRSPGGAGPIIAKAESQADEVAAQLEERARQLVGRSTSAEQAGRQIERSVRGPGGFIESFRAKQSELYDDLDNLIPTDKPVAVTETRRAFQSLTQPIPGAAETTRRMVNPRIASLAEGLELDAAGGTVPYQALRQLRTRVGQELDNGLVSDVPAAQWKRLYGALSEDLRSAADTPEAMSAWRRADRYTRAGLERIESIESVLNRSGGPEAIFRAATSGTKEGATTLRAVMQSVDDEGQRMVTATVLRRLGVAKAGVQGELGDRFSTETFLTNWNLLSPEAKATLFNRYGGGTFRNDMDQVAKFAANLRTGSKVFVNPSGTAQATTQAATAGAFVLSVLTGQVGPATTIAAGVTGANLLSRLMVNPRFVRFLARSTTVPQAVYPAIVNTLAQQAQSTEDVDLAQAALLLQQSGARREREATE